MDITTGNGKKIINRLGWLMKWIFIVVVVTFTLFPVIYIILGSFKDNLELMTGGNIIPKKWVFSNYAQAWHEANFSLYTWNSIIYCVFSTLGALIISSMSGYCIARKDFFGKKIIVGTYLSTMFITLGAVIYRPLYLMMVDLGLNKSLAAPILIQIGSQATNIFLVSKFVKGISTEMDEAARIDGCTTFGIYRYIMLPLIRPILGVVALFAFRDSWNAYILPSIFTVTNKNLMTLTVGVVSLKYSGGNAAQWNLMIAGASIAIIPMIIVYILANKQFIEGLTEGSVKG